MNNYAVICDVNCDLGDELRERFGVDGYIKGHLILPGDIDAPSKLSWDEIEPEAFFTALKSRKHEYKTSPASTEEMVAFLEPYLSDGKDLLVLNISSKMSAAYNLMINAQKILQEKFPERKVIVIDSRKYSVALGLLVMKACELRAQGLSIEENAARLEEIKATIHQMGTVDDLFYIASKGRITNSKAFFGTLVGIKPMGDFDSDGMVTVLAKAKGFDKAYKMIIEYIKKTIINPEEQIIIVAQTMREKQAKILVELIKEHIKPKEVILSDIYPANGVNIGPGLMGTYYFGTPISDLAYEKEVMNSIVESM